MSDKGFGTLANLAKILEEASDPESQLREDRRENKSKNIQDNSSAMPRKKTIDPKRKAWHDRRLREQMRTPQSNAPIPPSASVFPAQAVTRKTAATASDGLLSALAAAKDAKPKDGTKRPEAWKRKPGDPIF